MHTHTHTRARTHTRTHTHTRSKSSSTSVNVDAVREVALPTSVSIWCYTVVTLLLHCSYTVVTLLSLASPCARMVLERNGYGVREYGVQTKQTKMPSRLQIKIQTTVTPVQNQCYTHNYRPTCSWKAAEAARRTFT
jgi:hypothetical protein